jgi:hypothetical protein
VYLYIAFFWLGVGAVLQIFWFDIEPTLRNSHFTVDRSLLGLLCFVLFSYNFIRWRMARMLQRARQKDDDPPRRRADQKIDPTFDFTDRKTPDER